MATIRLIRTSEYNNWTRDYKIFIDGQQVGTIVNGETKDFTTTDGQHTVTAKIDWCCSPDLTIYLKDNQTKILKVNGFKYGQLLMPLGVGLIVLHFILTTFAQIDYVIFFALPFLFLFVYYITVGRKKFLTLYDLTDNKL